MNGDCAISIYIVMVNCIQFMNIYILPTDFKFKNFNTEKCKY